MITGISAEPFHIPLIKPFVTARRTASVLDSVLITAHTDEGMCGYGEASAAAAVTGETAASVIEAALNHIAPAVINMKTEDITFICERIKTSVYGNPSAKAGVVSAVYDLAARKNNLPLYRLLGGGKRALENNLTISAGGADEMTAGALKAVGEGHCALKIKLGKNPAQDGNILLSIMRDIDERWPHTAIRLRVDANQGWTPKEAVRIVNMWEENALPLEWVEQPVPAWDIDGLKYVAKHTETPVMADESVFTARDAARVLEKRAADIINIKLAKAGGITEALKIAGLCEIYNTPCVFGSMLESRLGASAAAHLAVSVRNAAAVDLDGPLLCYGDIFSGGPVFDGPVIDFTDDIGIGCMPERI